MDFLGVTLDDDALSAIGTLTKGTCDTLSPDIRLNSTALSDGGAVMNITADVSLYAQWVANQ